MNVDRLFIKLGYNLNDITRLSGGDINAVFKAGSSVYKVNFAEHYPKMFQKEANGLQLLSKAIKVPNVLRYDVFEDLQFIELEYLVEDSKTGEFWESFGMQLAALHKISNEQFGLDESNYIGSLVQNNEWESSWSEFYINSRLHPMIEMAVNSGEIDYVEAKVIDKFYLRLDEIFPIEEPALVHGDLWGGNYLCANGNQPFLIDPAVYYGHREMDIAMMHLFGGFESSIYEHYNNVYPLEKGWNKRIEFGQLYPLLVHVNLFGRSYWGRVEQTLKQFK
ncbi:fructosamine kinase family protein [Paracrocinitomix mangrovi]|uniref:fructosamine kinase family protein n=1 Tax=Paracrocinitomix mangrovi TaxID=2862509 RepID=UPI001C8E8BB7|nr:fructosamine kinase family protein [Paracrocinitomix mangrovi]UKN00424.1 fructosamine kinase family protein [Paracrocinitomix mangrovi]